MNRDDLWEEMPRPKAVEVLRSGDRVWVLVNRQRYMSWAAGDEGSARMALVQLYESGRGSREQLAAAFGVHVNSVQNYITHFAQEGFDGLSSRRRGPRGGWKLTPRRRSKILAVAMREGVLSVEAIQERLREKWHEELSAPSIRQVLEENGLLEAERLDSNREAGKDELFEFEGDRQLDLGLGKDREFSENADRSRSASSVSAGRGRGEKVPGKRCRYSSAQRVYLDRLEQGDYNVYAGGLLLVPLVERYEFLPVLKRVLDIPHHEGYSLEELCLTILYEDIFGFRSMEDFKRAYAEEFGALIGRSQSPSVFTLRRFLHKVKELKRGEELIDALAVNYLRQGMAQWGVMYIDGHFLPYHGMYPIRMGWHGVRQMAMKGSYNFLAVDEKFRPWLFLIRSASEDLVQKIPELIEKAKALGLAAGVNQGAVDGLIVLFDREGYSAELYRYLEGKDGGSRRAVFITWAKYADRWVDELEESSLNRTVKVFYAIRRPEEVRYVEMERTMNRYGKIRAIVIQSGKQKQRAAIYTNAKGEEIEADRVVRLMCRRWGEENQIKELLLKHMINYMPGYVIEDLEEQPWVDNPSVRDLKKRRAVLRSDLHRFKAQLAEEILKRTPSWAGPISAKDFPILESIARADNELLLISRQLEGLPGKIRFDEAHEGEKLMTLNYEKKRFLDCIKVFACNLQDAMCRMLLPYYDRPKEIQPALSMILERTGEIKLDNGQLQIVLRRFRNPEIDYAARRLCDDLNQMHPRTLDRFRIPLRYEVA